MTTTGVDWEYLIWILVYSVPTLIVWSVAIVYCFTRRRENPKGAVFLGLAILVQFLSTVFGYLFPYLMMTYSSSGSTSGMGLMPYLSFAITGISIVANVAVWILITMAVFARPKHYDYVGSSAFDDEIT